MRITFILAAALLFGCAPPAEEAPPGSPAPAPAPTPAPAPEPEPAGDADAGADWYAQTCVACHGTDARGVPNLGKDLVGTEYMGSVSDDDLALLIKQGRPPSDPDNTTGIDMPPKGGNPALTQEKILDIVAYLRRLAAEAAEG